MSGWGGRKVARLRALVIETYGVVCVWCRRPARLDVHHLHPDALTIEHLDHQSRGGSDDIENLRPAHRQCNLSRGDRAAPASAARRAHESGAAFFAGPRVGDGPPFSP